MKVSDGLKKVLRVRYEEEEKKTKAPDAALNEWRDIRALLANNRYSLTILLACAQRVALSKKTIGEACIAAEEFIRGIVDRVKTVSEQKREEVVLSDVLDAYESFDHVGKASDDMRLHLVLLRHLAVMVAPTSADVLVQAPEVRKYFEQVYANTDQLRKRRIVEALTELAERGLVFRIKPHPRLINRYDHLQKARSNSGKPSSTDIDDIYGHDASPETEYRYSLHRLMQRHILRKMGSGLMDQAQTNSFAPSLYASMPADLPRLNQEAYSFLGVLVANLSQYPDHRVAMPGAENWHYGKQPRSTQIQALRAALGIVRSSFSIAVVSRFEDYSRNGPTDTEHRGYFEEYRVQVRWLIRKSYELLQKAEREKGRDYDPHDEDRKHINAFYADETVWLYNECGVVNLVQGNLSDAVSLLRQAIAINRRIEGQMDGGAQHNRLSLNLAITQLERGRLRAARRRLLAICASESQNGQRKGRVWHIAHGYLGLIYHLSGDVERASVCYEQSIRMLRVYNDTRALAVFYRHFGDLERTQKRYKIATKYYKEAIGFAEVGGHEDVHKRVRLSWIRLEISRSTNKAEHIDVIQTMAELKTVGDYADTMEMPSLRTDVDLVRAELMLREGETTLAGELLSRNMTIAKRNDMFLRLNASLTRYAETLHLRGLSEQANNMLFASLDMAKRSGCQLHMNGVEQLFQKLHKSRNPIGR